MRLQLFAALLLALPTVAPAQSIAYGDDTSEWANDGECDDPRFIGTRMAADLDWADVMRDASDCRAGVQAGQLKLWNQAEAQAATSCAAIDFGADTGDYTNDGECDDPRFAGRGVDSILLAEDIGRDATDCARLCQAGALYLRNYWRPTY